ncbi:MAG: SMI1/KNR4 family protein [Bacteroidetes bacterium]|nr:SMI1/KNR4 family protein [Bacteroidota bacterium]
MNRQDEISYIESELKIHLPNTYKDFLLKFGSCNAFGLPILGLPAKYELNTALGATALLRLSRPELHDFLAIRIFDDRMLCLDLTKGNQVDASLVEVCISSNDQPIKVHSSFEKYIYESEQSKKQVEYSLRRIKNLYSNNLVKEYAHNKNEGKVPFKARDWRVHRCCVHDLVVGLTAFKYSEAFNGIEVDVFITTDHPDYEEGHGTKALMTLILSDAYRNGTSMEVRFTKFDSKEKKRVADNIPKSLLITLNSFGIKLQKNADGIITHEESIIIFSSLLGIQEDAKNKIKNLELTNEATLQGVCFLINSRVWTIEQINWLIINAERVKAVIFGRDNPENRINYSESLSLGRIVCTLTKLKEKMEISSDEEVNEVETKIKGEFFQLTSFKSCSIDWLPDNEFYDIEEGETITVLSRPREKWINFKEQIIEDIVTIRKEAGRKIILYSSEVFQYEDLNAMQAAIKNTDDLTQLELLIMPLNSEELNEEVISKMKKARTYRA